MLRQEESELAKAEAELRLAQQAFDQFLQEKDRNAVEAQRRYGLKSLGLEVLEIQYGN